MIKRYGTCLKLNTNGMTGDGAKRWVRSIVTSLNEIGASHTGQCVLRQLHRSGKHVVIVPDLYAGNGHTGAKNVGDGYYPFRPVRDGLGNRLSGYGTGKGTDAKITLTLYKFFPPIQAAQLLHEMTHAAEDNAGRMYCNAIGWQYLTTAEFDAILVQNVFLSERGRDSRMIQDHLPTRYLEGKMIPQLDAYKRLLSSFKARMPALVSDLSHVRAAFNPYRKGAKGWVELQ